MNFSSYRNYSNLVRILIMQNSAHFTVALKGHPVYLIFFIRRSFNRRFDTRTIVDSTLVTVDSTLVQSSIRRLYNLVQLSKRRFDARSIVDSTLVQSSFRRSLNHRFDARDRRFDACKTSTLFDEQGFQNPWN